jgi:hypothetical protein
MSTSDPTTLFAKDLGTWDARVTVTFPGAPPQLSNGVTVNRLVGGRWLSVDYRNAESGFEGHGLYGWDAARGAYVGTWVDNMRGSLVIAEGRWDADTRTMTYTSEVPGPGGTSMRLREVTETTGPDTQVMRSFIPGPDGAELEFMRVEYTRRPA